MGILEQQGKLYDQKVNLLKKDLCSTLAECVLPSLSFVLAVFGSRHRCKASTYL